MTVTGSTGSINEARRLQTNMHIERVSHAIYLWKKNVYSKREANLSCFKRHYSYDDA